MFSLTGWLSVKKQEKNSVFYPSSNKTEKEQEEKQKQQDTLTQIIVDMKKNVPNERGSRDHDSEIYSAILLDKLLNNKVK